MKQEEIKQLSNGDLASKIKEEKDSLGKLKLNHTVSPIENPMKITANRKLVARLMTELRSRELDKKDSK